MIRLRTGRRAATLERLFAVLVLCSGVCWATPSTARVVGIVFDDSRSLKGTFETTLYAAQTIVGMLAPDDRAFIAKVGEFWPPDNKKGAVREIPLKSLSERQVFLDKIMRDWNANGKMTPVSALTSVLEKVTLETNSDEDAAVIVLTDGYFEPEPDDTIKESWAGYRDAFKGRILRTFFVAIDPDNIAKSGERKGRPNREVIAQQKIAWLLGELFGTRSNAKDTYDVKGSPELYRALTRITTELMGGDTSATNLRVQGNRVEAFVPFPIDGLALAVPDGEGKSTPRLLLNESLPTSLRDATVGTLSVGMRQPDRANWPKLSSKIIQLGFPQPVIPGKMTLVYDRPVVGDIVPIYHTRLRPKWTATIGGEQISERGGVVPAVQGQIVNVSVTLTDDNGGNRTIDPGTLPVMPTLILQRENASDLQLSYNTTTKSFDGVFEVPIRPGAEHYVSQASIVLIVPGVLQRYAAPIKIAVGPKIKLELRAGEVSGDRLPCRNCQLDEVSVPYRSASEPAATLWLPVSVTPADYEGPLSVRTTSPVPNGVSLRLVAGGRESAPLAPDKRQSVEIRKMDNGKLQLKVEISGPTLETPALRLPELVVSAPTAVAEAQLGVGAATLIRPEAPKPEPLTPDGKPINQAPPILSRGDPSSRSITLKLGRLIDGEGIASAQLVMPGLGTTHVTAGSVPGNPKVNTLLLTLDPASEGWGEFLLLPLREFRALLGDGTATLQVEMTPTKRKLTLKVPVDRTSSWLAILLLVVGGLAEAASGIYVVLRGGYSLLASDHFKFPPNAYLLIKPDPYEVNDERRPLQRLSQRRGVARLSIPPEPERYSDQYVDLEACSGGVRLLRRGDYPETLGVENRHRSVAQEFRDDPLLKYIELSWGQRLRDERRNLTLVLANED